MSNSVFGVLVNRELQAFHESKKVVMYYADAYSSSHPNDLVGIVKFKKSAIPKIISYDDYYLSEVKSKIYIQKKYEEVFVYLRSDLLELDDTIKRLTEILLGTSINDREKSILLELIDLLKKRRKTINKYIPTLKELKEQYEQFEMYKERVR